MHRIFQTLNTAGVRLDQVDLIRNHLFMALPERGEALYESVWEPMELSEAVPRLLGDFLADDARVHRDESQQVVTDQTVYAHFQRRLEPIEGDEDAIEAELRSLSDRHRLYGGVLAPPVAGTDVERAIARLAEWGAKPATAWTLLVAMKADADELTEVEAHECLHLLESLMVRRMLFGVSTRTLRARLDESLAVVDRKLGGSDFVRAMHFALSRRANRWPSDSEIRARIAKRCRCTGVNPWIRSNSFFVVWKSSGPKCLRTGRS